MLVLYVTYRRQGLRHHEKNIFYTSLKDVDYNSNNENVLQKS